MICPKCNQLTTTVRRTQGARGRLLPGELRNLGIMRRRRLCLACNYKFFTIELLEAEFDALRQILATRKDTKNELL